MEGRIARLRDWMASEGLGAFLARDTSNIRWLTGFDGVFDAERAHALLVTREACVLHTDSRYSGACRKAAAAGSAVEIDEARASHAAWLADRLAALGVAGALGIEDDMALREFRALEAALAEREADAPGAAKALEGGAPVAPDVRETSGAVLSLRAVKDADEIERLRAAQAITDAAFSHIIGWMRPGMTEREVQIELEDFMLRHGAEGLAFPSIVATGANGASPHAIPGETRLEAGQCVVMDFGARAAGYCSDMTRMVFVGTPDARLISAYEALRAANEQVQAALRPGMTGAEAHAMALDVLTNAGWPDAFGHGLGHGVGIDIHEEPVLAPRNDAPLTAGNVVTVEPGIYVEGDFGMRLEDCGVLLEDGYHAFGTSTHEMAII